MNNVTVWYDNNCPLCRREVALMRRLDRKGRVQFVDATDPATTCPLNRADMLARFHAMERGQLVSGAEAFAAMWRAIPLLWPLGTLARLPGALRVLEWAYLKFLKHRPRLQRLFQ